ncbi:MAG: hypothetical protein GY953_18475 [bacterium]|nr:hypothetical protein [bacterium]
MPYQRTGLGHAADGRPKFDLSKFNTEYFDRLRRRVMAAGERGIYTGVMLFQGFSVARKGVRRKKTPWSYHPLNGENNINGIDGDPDGDGEGYETHERRIAEVTRIQDAFVRKVVNTVNDLGNVIYEVGNECHGASTAWQYHVINLIQEYEGTKPEQHPTWMSYQYDGIAGRGTDEDLFQSPATAVSPRGSGKRSNYITDPPASRGDKIVIADTDHIAPTDLDRADWVWKIFTRGLHPIFMDDPPVPGAIEHPAFKDTGPGGPASRTRAAMGHTLAFARRMNLAAMHPTNEAGDCSTRYCLRNPGAEYLVYQPQTGPVDVLMRPGAYRYEWSDPVTGETVQTGRIEVAGQRSSLNPPAGGGSIVLYVKAFTLS